MLRSKSSHHHEINSKPAAKLSVHVLVAMFGLSAWIDVNALFIELPILVKAAPEGFKLIVYLVIVIQLANIAPVLYAGVTKIANVSSEKNFIIGLIAVDVLCNTNLAFFHDWKMDIFGAQRSVGLIGFMFLLACTACTSSVSFLPYIQHFDETYLVSYFIGQGFSGVIPSLIATLQGVKRCDHKVISNFTNSTSDDQVDLLFPPRDYFLIISGCLLISLAAFLVLEKLPGRLKKADFVPISNDDDLVNATPMKTFAHSQESPSEVKEEENLNFCAKHDYLRTIYLYVLLGVICALSMSILSAVMPYSSSAYGHDAYHYAVIISQIANPITCMLGLWILPTNIRIINWLVFAVSLLTFYVFWLAFSSPRPPLVDYAIGKYIMILAAALLSSLTSYLKLSITSVFRNKSNRGLFYVGVTIQVGAFLGAAFSYLMIVQATLFEEPHCNKMN